MFKYAIAGLLCAAGAAAAQPVLYAVDFSGNLYTVNPATAGSALVGFTGFDRLNAAAADDTGQIYVSRFRLTTVPADENQLIRVDPATGAGILIASYGTANDLRALAFSNGILYGILEGVPDSLVTIDRMTGAVTMVGPTGRSDVQGLTADGSGQLYGVGVSGSGSLYAIDSATGFATVISGSTGAQTDSQSIEWFEGTQAWLARVNLRTIDLTTGMTTVVGTMAISDVRGLALVGEVKPPCYANCDGSTGEPVLTVDDFTCFINEFAAAQGLPYEQQVSHYANCDSSTTVPVLTVDDFTCFINEFAGGCP